MYMCIYMYVCTYVCVYVCVYVCMNVKVYIYMRDLAVRPAARKSSNGLNRNKSVNLRNKTLARNLRHPRLRGVCVCAYIYMCVHIFICVCIYICEWVSVCVRACVCLCVCVSVCLCVCVCLRRRVRVYVRSSGFNLLLLWRCLWLRMHVDNVRGYVYAGMCGVVLFNFLYGNLVHMVDPLLSSNVWCGLCYLYVHLLFVIFTHAGNISQTRLLGSHKYWTDQQSKECMDPW
jgi:fucose permease